MIDRDQQTARRSKKSQYDYLSLTDLMKEVARGKGEKKKVTILTLDKSAANDTCDHNIL